MKIRGNILFVFSILTLLLLFNIKSYSITSLDKCFRDSGAELIMSQIEGNAVIDTSDSSEEAAGKIFSGMDYGYEVKGYWDNQMYTIKFTNKDIDITIRAKSVEAKKKIYASVVLSQYRNSVNINNVWRDVAESFSCYGVQPSCLSLITGKFNYKMTGDEMDSMVLSIFSANNIRTVDRMSGRNMISICGYMPGMENYILDGKEKININIALRYSETYGCTYISIGSPIIAVEY